MKVRSTPRSPVTSPGHLSKGQSRLCHTCKTTIFQCSDSSRGAAGTLVKAKVIPWANGGRHKWGIREVNSFSLWKGIIRNGRGRSGVPPSLSRPLVCIVKAKTRCQNFIPMDFLSNEAFNNPRWTGLGVQADQTPAHWGESHQGHHTEDISIPALLRESEQWPKMAKWPKHNSNENNAVVGVDIDSLISHCHSHTIWAQFCFFIFLATIKNFTQAKIPAVTKNKEPHKRISRKGGRLL